MKGKADSGKSQCSEYSSSVNYTWKISNFSTLNTNTLYSDTFTAGGHKWWIIIYPKGDNSDHFSIYLGAAHVAVLPDGWTRHAKFSLSVISEVGKHTIRKETEHTFNASKAGWGFPVFMPLGDLHNPDLCYLVEDTCTVRAEVWYNEKQEKGEADLSLEKSSSSFAEFDNLFTGIQNLLEVKTTPSSFSDKEIADAQTIFEQCLNMDLTSVIRSGKAPELKNSLSIMLTTNSFPQNMVDRITEFLADFDERCERYEAAQRDLREAQENEESVAELRTTLKQLSSKFMPVRNQAEAADSEIARLEILLTEMKAKRVRLGKRLDDLAGQATTSKQALVSAEEISKLSSIKKEQAEKIVGDFQRSWESLKV